MHMYAHVEHFVGERWETVFDLYLHPDELLEGLLVEGEKGIPSDLSKDGNLFLGCHKLGALLHKSWLSPDGLLHILWEYQEMLDPARPVRWLEVSPTFRAVLAALEELKDARLVYWFTDED